MEDKPENTPEDNAPEQAATATEKPTEAPKGPQAPNEVPKQAANAADGAVDKILGIPVGSYVKLCYLLVLIASGFGVFSYLVGLVGVYVPGGQLFGLVGLSGFVLALIGWFAFAEKLKPIDMLHQKYIVILFAAFFVVYVVLAGSLGWFGFFGQIVMLLIASLQFAALYIGLNLWKEGKEPTKESVLAEFNILKDTAVNKIKKVDDGIE